MGSGEEIQKSLSTHLSTWPSKVKHVKCLKSWDGPLAEVHLPPGPPGCTRHRGSGEGMQDFFFFFKLNQYFHSFFQVACKRQLQSHQGTFFSLLRKTSLPPNTHTAIGLLTNCSSLRLWKKTAVFLNHLPVQALPKPSPENTCSSYTLLQTRPLRFASVGLWQGEDTEQRKWR